MEQCVEGILQYSTLGSKYIYQIYLPPKGNIVPGIRPFLWKIFFGQKWGPSWLSCLWLNFQSRVGRVVYYANAYAEKRSYFFSYDRDHKIQDTIYKPYESSAAAESTCYLYSYNNS